jgi:hypothetical protein
MKALSYEHLFPQAICTALSDLLSQFSSVLDNTIHLSLLIHDSISELLRIQTLPIAQHSKN